VELQRPGVVTLLGVLDLVGGGLLLLSGILMTLAVAGGKTPEPVALVLTAAYALVGVAYVAAGVGMLKLRSWGRTLQIVFACIGLLGIPCGTLISVLILVYLLKPGVRILFSGREAQELSPGEAAEVRQLMQGSGSTVVIVIVVAILSVFGIGMLAAIAIPSLLRARVAANEAAAIGDLRTVLSAEVAYASANGNYPDRLECLIGPSKCIPGYAANAPVFLSPAMATETRRGYAFQFHPGPPAPTEVMAQGKISASSLSGFAYLAVPINQNATGIRSFCVDGSGRICASSGPEGVSVSGATCPRSCASLR
jgi:type II secretory pathway pseudopilin PulG